MNMYDDFVKAIIDYNYHIMSNVDHNCIMTRNGMKGTPPNSMDFFIVHRSNMSWDIAKYMNNTGPQGSMEIDRAILQDQAIVNSPTLYAIFIYDRQWDDIQVYSSKHFGDGVFAAPKVITDLIKFVNKTPSTMQSPPSFGAGGGPPGIGGGTPPQAAVVFKAPASPPFTAELKFEIGKDVKVTAEKNTNCDCGAHKLGYKDSDDFAHSGWCKTHNFKGIPF